MAQILEVTQNTVFKRRPLQSSQLQASEMASVASGVKISLQSYAYADVNGDFDGHFKFAIRDQKDYIQGITTWYVYELHARVVEDGKVVYPQVEQENALVLKVTQDTAFKRSPVQASQLKPEDIESVPQGSMFALQSYAYANENGDFNDHIKIALAKQADYIRGITTWYVYERHAQVFFDKALVYPSAQPSSPPRPTPAPSTWSGSTIQLPGYNGIFYLEQPIIPGGSFTWGEATKNGTRPIPTKRIVDNIMALAKAMEAPRKQLGRPFVITSWYRDPDSNRRAGGATNSMHLYGKAADIQIVGYSQRQAAIDLAWWPGGLGSYAGWIHLDTGSRRRWRQ
jgi:hypothetical protein